MSEEKIISKFNKNLIWLIGQIEKRNRFDTEIARLKTRIITAKNTSNDVLIKTTGPYLVKYNDQIIKRDEQFLLYDDVEEFQNIDKEYEFCIAIINKLRAQYETLSNKEKDDIFTKVNDMLEGYLDYLELTINN